MSSIISRREMIARSGMMLSAGAAGAWLPRSASAFADSGKGAEAFGYCFNTSTIRGQNLSIVEQIEIAATAGFQGIEPWLRDVTKFQDEGGSLSELRKRIADLGLSVESAIAFPKWSVDDEAERAQGIEQFKTEAQRIADIGGVRIAAPPSGSTKATGMDLFQIAERYRTILEIGADIGVVPQLEIWGSSTTLSRLGEAALVAVEAGHPDACLLLDVYHLYKGGSEFEGLRMLNGAAMHVWHINDYPADPPRETITDADRVYPGDGAAPLDFILRTLYQTGYRGMLSLELFNREYWKQDALQVARTGRAKIQAAVERALG